MSLGMLVVIGKRRGRRFFFMKPGSKMNLEKEGAPVKKQEAAKRARKVKFR